MGKVRKFPGERGAKANAALLATGSGQQAKVEQPQQTINAGPWTCPFSTARWVYPDQGAAWQERCVLPCESSKRLAGDDEWRRAIRQAFAPYYRWFQQGQESQWSGTPAWAGHPGPTLRALHRQRGDAWAFSAKPRCVQKELASHEHVDKPDASQRHASAP
eukprot:4182793-Amphidinium_carterae.2